MRFLFMIFLYLLLSCCKAEPIDLKIPKDHPANPQGAVPRSNSSDYIYSLPISSDLLEKSADQKKHHGLMTEGSGDEDAEAHHSNPKSMGSKTNGHPAGQ